MAKKNRKGGPPHSSYSKGNAEIMYTFRGNIFKKDNAKRTVVNNA